MTSPAIAATTWVQTLQPDGKLHSAQPIDVTGPSIPGISLSNAASNGFRISLGTASIDVQSGIANYVLENSTVSSTGPWTAFATKLPSEFPYDWNGALAGRQYWVRAKAVDGSIAANQSTPSSVQTITTTSVVGSGPDTTYNPDWPRLAAAPFGGNPRCYDTDAFIQWASKLHFILMGIWDGWQTGDSATRVRSFAAACALIRSTSPLSTPSQPIVYFNALTKSLTAEKNLTEINSAKFWLYANYLAGGSPVNADYWAAGYGVYNRTPGGPTITINSKTMNGIQYMVDYYNDIYVKGGADGLAKVVSGSFGANSNVRGSMQDDPYPWAPATGDWNRDGNSETKGTNSATTATDAQMRAGCAQASQRWATNNPSHYLGLNTGFFTGGVVPTSLAEMAGIFHLAYMEGCIGNNWSPETWGGFAQLITTYKRNANFLIAPKIMIFSHSNVRSDGRDFYGAGTTYRDARYGLGCCSIGDGYYSADGIGTAAVTNSNSKYNANNRNWFDEWAVNSSGAALAFPSVDAGLGYWGQPLDAAFQPSFVKGVYRRRFYKAATNQEWHVFTNPKGNGAQSLNTTDLGGNSYKKITGNLETTVNNGATVTSFTLQDRDMLVVRKL